MPEKTIVARDLSSVSILRTESASDLARVMAAVRRDIGPTDFYEDELVADAAHYVAQKMRYRRISAGLFNNAIHEALTRVLGRLKFPGRNIFNTELAIDNLKQSASLAELWIHSDPDATNQVRLLLEEAGLDEGVIEAEAFVIAGKPLEHAQRMLSAATEGLEATITALAKYRKKLAPLVRQNAERVLAADDVPPIAGTALN